MIAPLQLRTRAPDRTLETGRAPGRRDRAERGGASTAPATAQASGPLCARRDPGRAHDDPWDGRHDGRSAESGSSSIGWAFGAGSAVAILDAVLAVAGMRTKRKSRGRDC
ncbi:hypothetical protein [Leifsonia aquatica]|uniref:hypothetical protein n=1 Tax=Leifsonia aquatica TaxID=144185 RepID=UPI00382415D2